MDNQIYLRAFEYSDLSLLNAIRNDDRLYETTGGNKYFISSEYDKKWIEDKIFNNSNQLYLVICSKDTDQPVGYVCATNIDYRNRKAEWGGLVISGEFSGKGFGTNVGRLLIDHLFYELGLNMIYLYIKEGNKASVRIAGKLGFHNDGLIREYVYKQNQFHNVYIFTLLKSEYKESIQS